MGYFLTYFIVSVFLNKYFTGSTLEIKRIRAIFRKRAHKKRLKKSKKGQNIWKFGQKCTKCENILKKGRWLRAIIAHKKLLEKALFYISRVRISQKVNGAMMRNLPHIIFFVRTKILIDFHICIKVDMF